MLIQPIDYFLVVWFAIAAGSTLYVGLDQYRNNPEPVAMKWGFLPEGTLKLVAIMVATASHQANIALPISEWAELIRIEECP